jgi:thiamine-monophosphate kinase
VKKSVSMKAEDLFVERLRAMLPASERVTVGPGDDAAVVRVESGDLVVTTDMVVEGVDFLPDTDPEAIGRRALAVNLSDLAAMGARPDFFLLSIGFEAQRGEDFPLGVARGALSRARPLGANLIGGDLSSSPQTIVSIALWGRAETRPALRSGATAGDLLFVTGFPGRAAAGLSLARGLAAEPREPAGLAREQVGELLAAYRDPEPRVALGLELSRRHLWSAAIDVSDGIGVDAARLARASGLRAVIEKASLPVSPALAAFGALENKEPLQWILGGGDDYELLFAAPESALAAIGTLASREVPITRIGRLEEGGGVLLRDGAKERDVSSLGHDHLERGR